MLPPISLTHSHVNFSGSDKRWKGWQPSYLELLDVKKQIFDGGRLKENLYLNTETGKPHSRTRTRFNDGRLVVRIKRDIGERLVTGHNSLVEFVETTFKPGEKPTRDRWQYETKLEMNPDGATVDDIVQTKVSLHADGSIAQKTIIPSYTRI